MKLYVGVTDIEWFRFLAARQPDEVNFWRPSERAFRVLQPGAPLLFKLHSPYNMIAGGGFFVKYALLPLSIVWDAFREKNGVPDQATLLAKIRHYRRGQTGPDPLMGCISLVEPFFFEEDAWIPVPEDWHPNLVQGKSYDTAEANGARLWAAVQERLQQQAPPTEARHWQRPLSGIQERRYGAEYLTRSRLGQGTFRVMVTDAYQKRCAITGEKTLPILQASHIRPYGEGGPHQVSNGMLLRADVHILFDLGYLTVTDDLRVEVSPRIKHDYGNGRDYYAMHGRELVVVPSATRDHPSPEFLRWHQDHKFAV